MAEPPDETVTLSYASRIDPRADLLCLRSLRWFALGIGALVVSVPCIWIGVDASHIRGLFWLSFFNLVFGWVCLFGSLACSIVSMVFGYIALIKYKAVRWWVVVSTIAWLLLTFVVLGIAV
jgi:hypothetical protein